MPKIPDVGVALIYGSLIAIYGFFSLWLFGLWRKAKADGAKPLLLALFFLAAMMAIDNIVWIFGTMAYSAPPVPVIRDLIKDFNIWAFEKILWGIAGLIVWRSLR